MTKKAPLYRCVHCEAKTPLQVDGNFRKCRECGYSYRFKFGKELSAAIDAYVEGAIGADEVVQASFDQDFADITRENADGS
jgi:hypothetical protein